MARPQTDCTLSSPLLPAPPAHLQEERGRHESEPRRLVVSGLLGKGGVLEGLRGPHLAFQIRASVYALKGRATEGRGARRASSGYRQLPDSLGQDPRGWREPLGIGHLSLNN